MSIIHYVHLPARQHKSNSYSFLAKPSYGLLQVARSSAGRAEVAPCVAGSIPAAHRPVRPTLGNSFMRVVCRGMRYRAISHSNSTLRIIRYNDPRGGIDSFMLVAQKCRVATSDGVTVIAEDRASSWHPVLRFTGTNEKQETRLIPHMKALSGTRDGPCPPAYTQGQLETVVWVALDRKEASTPLRWYL